MSNTEQMHHDAIILTALRIDPFGADGTLYKLASSSPETLSAFVAAFVADEREACAKTCEGISHMASSNAPVLCAMNIRARGRQATFSAHRSTSALVEALEAVSAAIYMDDAGQLRLTRSFDESVIDAALAAHRKETA